MKNGIRVSAPNLLSLRLERCSTDDCYSVGNVGSLIAASFDFERILDWNGSYDSGISQVVRLLDAVSHVRTLKLCSWCLQVLSIRERNQEKPLLFGATYLELKTKLYKWDLLGMAYLLKGFLNLEELVVNIGQGGGDISTKNLNDYEFDENEYWDSLDFSLSCQLQQLNTIKVYGFMGSKRLSTKEKEDMVLNEFIDRRKNEVLLVEFFLKNCKGLEKVIIRTTKHVFSYGCKEKSELLLFNLSRRLLLLPRASQSAEIVFT